MPTPNLGLPQLAADQAQKHVTVNGALNDLDALVQLSVLDRHLSAPPGTPVAGARYIVAAGPTGAWASHANHVAAWFDGAWRFFVPSVGWVVYVVDEQRLLAWTGSAWADALAAVQNVPMLGIFTAPDSTNRLAVKSNAVLFSHDDVTPGSGNMQAVLNKAASGKDAGFVFQVNWSARALFGLLGDDDFTIKVSPDGSSYKTAIVADKDDGAVHHPEGSKFSAYLNFGQDYTAGAWRDLLMNNFRHNDQADAAIAANVLTFTAPTAGYYLFGISATYEAGSVPTKMQVGISIGGATPTSDTIGTTGDATVVSGETQCNATALLKLAAGNTVSPKIFFTGATGRVLASENYFWGVRIA